MNSPKSVLPYCPTNEPVFEEPWHAQVLAVADTLITANHFSAAQWSEALGKARKSAEENQSEDSAKTYYTCALLALENLLSANCNMDNAAISQRCNTWKRAYLATAHGQPVLLSAGENAP